MQINHTLLSIEINS